MHSIRAFLALMLIVSATLWSVVHALFNNAPAEEALQVLGDERSERLVREVLLQSAQVLLGDEAGALRDGQLGGVVEAAARRRLVVNVAAVGLQLLAGAVVGLAGAITDGRLAVLEAATGPLLVRQEKTHALPVVVVAGARVDLLSSVAELAAECHNRGCACLVLH